MRPSLLKQFLETARGRLDKAFALLGPSLHEQSRDAVREIHTLTGEAAILGFKEIGDLSALAEAEAKLWHTTASVGSLTKCMRLLRDLRRTIDRLEAPTQRILVVDDSEINRSMLQDSLAGEGWSVGVASDVASAQAEARHTAPTLLLCDVNLTGCSVIDVVSAVREVSPDLRVLIVSGDDAANLGAVVAQTRALGAVSKRSGTAAIIAAVRAAVEQRR